MTCNNLILSRRRAWDDKQDIEQDKIIRKLIWDKIATEKELLFELINNPWLMIELQFTIINKEFKEVPFFLNDSQKEFQREFINEYNLMVQGQKEQVKITILKARQMGMTAYITALQLCFTLLKKNFSGFTMAHDSDSTKSIFEDVAKTTYKNIIDNIKAKTKKSNAKELIFEEINTSWRIGTSGSSGTGRGKKINFLHNSEIAFWKDMQVNQLAISQALTPRGSIEINETTANSYNDFYEHWQSTKNKKSKFKGLFFPWWIEQGYYKKFIDLSREEFLKVLESGERFEGVDSAFIKKLHELYLKENLDLEKIYWYFDKRKELRGKLSQEYPCNDSEAFLHSGSPYFDIELLDILLSKPESEKKVLNGGDIEIFKNPESNRKYIIGSDVAEGLKDGDSSTFCILDMQTREEVANGEYKVPPDEHGRILAKYGKLYNNALIVVERNNHGHSTLNTLKNDIRYSNLYTERKVDTKTNKTTNKLGWHTNATSKYIMLDSLDIAIRNNEIEIKSHKTLKELREVQNEDSKININGKDRIVALAIANQVAKDKKKRVITSISRPYGF